ncbi:MAG TPA: tetratricopeptide repeat protein [Pyrinomonadaceae bacterium]|nr:tetratricopeptide repeat protein [Pyrinomonadaceae bacterium]
MPTFYDSNGKPYALSIEIGRGGEGTVFYCPNDLSLVAKIYHEPIDKEKAEKLQWMAANRNDGLLKVAAWIVDTLHDKPNGKIVGFVMPNVKAKEIHELYSLKSRRVHFPEATWKFLLHTAANVARAFYVLHKNDHIMGDVNHGNCVVLADGTVKLIDCDSYSIKTDKMRYACEVGVATHLAPELQGIDLGEVIRERKHDNFGLAVIIFQLLFLGRHPFAGNYLGEEDKSLEDCIREHRFAYGNQSVTNVKQPPGTLALSQIPSSLAVMFTKAFMTENRPEPREWIEALEDLSNNLKQCGAHIGHYYFQELTICPWCGIEAQTGLILFPFISNENGEKGFNIFTIESLLASLEVPRNLPAKPFKPEVLPLPSLEALELNKKARNRIGIFVFLQFVLVFIWTVLGGASSGISLGIFVGLGFYFINQKLNKDYRENLDLELNEARQNWIRLENDWKQNNRQNLLDNDLTLIRQKISDHQALQNERREQLANLKEEAFQYHLRLYLSHHKLTDLDISPIYLTVLVRYGLQSAADIEEKRLRPMLALDDATKTYLLEWREKLEKDFEFQPDSELPEVAKNRFEIEFTENRRKIKREIEHLLSILRSGSTMLQQQQKLMMSKAETFAQKLLQAESNLKAVGDSKQLLAFLILITVFVPTFGAIFRGLVSPNRVVRNVSAGNGSGSGSGKTVTQKPVVNIEPTFEPNFKVDENISDLEIERMSANERYKSARFLYQQSIPLFDGRYYSSAERKLDLAVRFVDYDVKILYSYADVLYNLKKYNESIKQLQQLLKIDSENENARLLIGANYLKMNRLEESKGTFLQVLDKNPSSFEANFNLGIIYENQKAYDLAVIKFGKSLEIDSRNTDVIYEQGFCFYKMGEKEKANNIYKNLINLDEEKAEKLRKIIKAKKIAPSTVVIPDRIVVTKTNTSTLSTN